LLRVYEAVRTSEFVQGNPHYAAVANKATFEFDRGNPEYNAYAAENGHRRLNDGRVVTGPAIVVFGGLVETSWIASAFLADPVVRMTGSAHRQVVISRLRLLGAKLRDLDRPGLEILGHSAELALGATGTRRIAEEVHDGMLANVLAHEMGHLCLHHTARPSGTDAEVQRNQEREADSFSSSVLQSLQSRPQMFIGQALHNLLLAWQEMGGGERPEATHPQGRDRFLAVLQSQRTAMLEAESAYGIGENDWRELLPTERQGRDR